MIKTIDIGWVAGLLEGEGHFNIDESPAIHLQMCDLDIIEKFKRITKISSGISVRLKKNEKHNTAYRVIISGSLAIQWMMTIYPLMGDRRKERIRKIIRLWKTMTGVRGINGSMSQIKMIKLIAMANNISFDEADILWQNTNNSLKVGD